MIDLHDFFDKQLADWHDARARYDALDSVVTKMIDIDGFSVTVTFNPARIKSSAAKIDAASIASRPCFLCDKNRPVEQSHIDLAGLRLLVNPFPILKPHFTLPAIEHCPQHFADNISLMAEVAQALPDMAIFYNGPHCGASAPDHFHFQAVEAAMLPLISAATTHGHIPFGILHFSGVDAVKNTTDALALLPHGVDEPMVNLFCWHSTYKSECAGNNNVLGDTHFIIIPRRRHRPDFYGEDGMLISPASLDLAGIMVAPRMSDFEKFTPDCLRDIYTQLCFTQTEVNEFVASK